MSRALVTGSFADLRSRHVRFLEEAARSGPVHVLLWSDEAVRGLEGQVPGFSEEERRYVLEAIRYVDRVTLVQSPVERDSLPAGLAGTPAIWVADRASHSPAKQAWCRARGLDYRVVSEAELQGFPDDFPDISKMAAARPSRKKVLVTGCYDWLHSGHVRFFEEVSELGELYVVVGHDDNIRLLKGPGHPMFPAVERRYMAGAIRHVKEALISTGHGWLDAEPEIERLRPEIYAVNEDGDQPEKREYCEAHGIEYRVLKRVPKEGLPRRESTKLRGF
jgi:cytidyltransferase-like protein